MVHASVIVCTHNPRLIYLRRVLEALRSQTLPLEQWELLLIDNASSEPLTSTTLDMSWHPHALLFREEKLGLASARLRGMQEASADLIVFVDDDNVLATNYLSEAIRIKRDWPILGVWGSGTIVPEFEVEPAEHLREFLGMLVFRNDNRALWSNVIRAGVWAWGAGQCVRANVAMSYRQYFENSAIKITDRTGGTLFSGGDGEICFVAYNIGLGVGTFPELKLTHLIPKERLSEDYLVRLAEGNGITGQLLDYKQKGALPKSPFSSPTELLRVLKNLVVRQGFHRRMYVASLRSRLRALKMISETTGDHPPTLSIG
jgi:glycosyltransferase involved in cell wall biosynthesis